MEQEWIGVTTNQRVLDRSSNDKRMQEAFVQKQYPKMPNSLIGVGQEDNGSRSVRDRQMQKEYNAINHHYEYYEERSAKDRMMATQYNPYAARITDDPNNPYSQYASLAPLK